MNKLRFCILIGVLMCWEIGASMAQVVSVTNMRQNVVITGMSNPLRILMEGTSCAALSVSTDNGKIVKTGACEYALTPARDGMTQVVVKSNRKTYNYLLRSEGLPQLQAFVGAQSGGMMTKSNFVAQRGIYVRHPGVDVKSAYKVSSYSYQIIRDDKTIQGRAVKGPAFGRDMQQQFGNVMRHDIVIFYQIVASDEQGNSIHVNPVQFLIK